MNRWAVFVSGAGSNLENFLKLEARLKNQKIGLVVADRLCPALKIAESYSKPVFQYDPKKTDFNERLLQSLEREKINSIFLMGYMRILSQTFLKRWHPQRILNIHPSLLPKYKGKNAIEEAIRAGEEEVGVSIHEVVFEVDSGKILLQKRIRREGMDRDRLMPRVHSLEHEMVEEFLFALDRA